MYPDREVFPASPLALAAAEVRFTDAARLRQQQTRDDVTIVLEERFPFAESLHRTDFDLAVARSPHVQQQAGVVLKNASSTETVTILPGSLTYETTAYTSFDEFLRAVTQACDALAEVKVRPAVRRIGLRYIDEVRVPEPITDVRQWSKWINSNLFGQFDVVPASLSALMTQGVSLFDLGADKGLAFRYAALDQGPVVVPQFLKPRSVGSGPFFVLDFDGFQDFAGDDEVPLISDVVRDALSIVHVPCGTAFQRSITDEARKLFRGTPS